MAGSNTGTIFQITTWTEDVEEVASIYRSYYESLDEIEADLAAEGKPSNGSDYELQIGRAHV